MNKITDLIDGHQVIQEMDKEVADETHKINSKILAEISKKITQSMIEMRKTERQQDKEAIDREKKIIREIGINKKQAESNKG